MKTRRCNKVHPGELLKRRFLKPINMSVKTAAQVLDLPVTKVRKIVKGKTSVTHKIADRLSAVFPPSSQFWLSLQYYYNRGLCYF